MCFESCNIIWRIFSLFLFKQCFNESFVLGTAYKGNMLRTAYFILLISACCSILGTSVEYLHGPK